jgi:hypothetical protein
MAANPSKLQLRRPLNRAIVCSGSVRAPAHVQSSSLPSPVRARVDEGYNSPM